MFRNAKKINSTNFSTFLLVVQFVTQIEFNFNNFIFYGACLPQLGSVPSLAIGLSNNDVIPLRLLRCVRCVGWKPRFTR